VHFNCSIISLPLPPTGHPHSGFWVAEMLTNMDFCYLRIVAEYYSSHGVK